MYRVDVQQIEAGDDDITRTTWRNGVLTTPFATYLFYQDSFPHDEKCVADLFSGQVCAASCIGPTEGHLWPLVIELGVPQADGRVRYLPVHILMATDEHNYPISLPARTLLSLLKDYLPQ